VKSGIPIKLAKIRLKDIPDAVFLPVDETYYQQMSDKAMGILKKYADKFELVGIDEAFVEVSEKAEGFDKAGEIAVNMKEELKKELGLQCSTGIAPNKLVAKIASDYQKPNGLTIVRPEDVEGFLKDLGVGKILGVGKKTEARLNEMGARTIGELYKIDIYRLTKEFGKKTGTYLYNAARGIDDEPLVESESVTQISRITTLKKNASSTEEMVDDLQSLCADVYASVMERGFSFKSVGIILILGNLSIKTKSRSLKSPTNSIDELIKVSRSLVDEAFAEDQLSVRRLGVKVSDLTASTGQDTLFSFMSD
jgi:DNA polymerase IV (DinB-like DNA polymerase)